MLINTEYGEAIVMSECALLDSTESLAWLTEVHEAMDGSEQRYALRDAPRQVLEFNYVQRLAKEMGDMRNTITANIRSLFAVPYAPASVSIPDVEDSDIIEVNPDPDLRVGYALVKTESGIQAVEIIEVNADNHLVLSNPITVTNARIIPLRICYIDADAMFNSYYHFETSSFRFIVLAEDSPYLLPTPITKFDGFDVYLDDVNSESIDFSISQQQNILDNQVGAFTSLTRHNRSKQSRSITKLITDFRAFKNFLYLRGGRLNPFILPHRELEISFTTTGLISTVINTNNEYNLKSAKDYVFVSRKNGTSTMHKITAKTSTSITVTPSINTQANQITRMSYASVVRLGNDLFNFNFLGNGVVETTFQAVEI